MTTDSITLRSLLGLIYAPRLAAHVQPLSGSIPRTLLNSWWNWTRIQLTAFFSQSRMNMTCGKPS